MRIETYSPDKRESWNTFVAKSDNGSIFHDLDFLDYHGDEFGNDNHLMFYRKNKLYGIIPLCLFDAGKRVEAHSPFGASYGGLVYRTYTPFRRIKEMVELFVNHIHGIDKTVIRQPPYYYSKTHSEYVEYLLQQCGFTVKTKEILSVVDLLEKPFFSKDCWWAIRKAKKHRVTVQRCSKEYDVFYQLLEDTYSKHHKRLTHTLDELVWLINKFPDNIRINMAYLKDEPIAGICNFLVNPRVNLQFYNTHKESHKTYSGVNLLLDDEIQWSLDHGYRYFDLGTTASEEFWNPSLFRFKESFGAIGVIRNTYSLEANK